MILDNGRKKWISSLSSPLKAGSSSDTSHPVFRSLVCSNQVFLSLSILEYDKHDPSNIWLPKRCHWTIFFQWYVLAIFVPGIQTSKSTYQTCAILLSENSNSKHCAAICCVQGCFSSYI